jgi:hypothetical protein
MKIGRLDVLNPELGIENSRSGNSREFPTSGNSRISRVFPTAFYMV